MGYNIGMIKGVIKLDANESDIVHYDEKLDKDLRKLPDHILEKLLFWVKAVNALGIVDVRKSKGFHDEPLHGNRKGQRSIRLSKSYRAIYVEDKQIIRITVIEVNKHEY